MEQEDYGKDVECNEWDVGHVERRAENGARRAESGEPDVESGGQRVESGERGS